MGIEVVYRRMSPTRLRELEANPMRAMEELIGLPDIDMNALFANLPLALDAEADDGGFAAAVAQQEADPARVDLGKDWHALHFLLTGDASLDAEPDPDNPLACVVPGGEPTAIETSYGPARVFQGELLHRIRDALSQLSVAQLRSRFSADALNGAEIYPTPSPGGWSEEEAAYLFEVYPRLQQLFRDAASSEEVVLVYTL